MLGAQRKTPESKDPGVFFCGPQAAASKARYLLTRMFETQKSNGLAAVAFV
jgi:hypothetical protein